jgi:pimeloyl-ACP methyl ester carboxylesterase
VDAQVSRALLLLALALHAAGAPAQDYEREKRLAAEVMSSVVVGDAVQVKLPNGREFLGLYTEVKQAKTAVLLVHGVGVHPDFGVIGSLRVALADLGLTTLSIQMPVQKSDARLADYYPTVFPEAVERIRAGARWLAAKGYAGPVVLGHSMGAWMVNVYYEETTDPPFSAWICIGLTGGFGGMGNVRAPVLDVYGEQDLASVTGAAWRRRFVLNMIEGARQLEVAGANHHYNGKEKELAAAIRDFVAQAAAGK